MPAVSNISSPSQLGASDATSKSSNTSSKNEVDRDMFLKLLVAQLKYQDPMNPTDPSQFLAQTAQFTTVEKLTQMAEESTKSALGNRMTTASSMIGKAVSYLGAGGSPAAGLVVSARITDDGEIMLNIGNNTEISLDEVKAMGQPGTTPTTTAPTSGSKTGGSATS